MCLHQLFASLTTIFFLSTFIFGHHQRLQAEIFPVVHLKISSSKPSESLEKSALGYNTSSVKGTCVFFSCLHSFLIFFCGNKSVSNDKMHLNFYFNVKTYKIHNWQTLNDYISEYVQETKLRNERKNQDLLFKPNAIHFRKKQEMA